MAEGSNYIGGLDVGTHQVTAAIGRFDEKGQVEIVGFGSAPNKGLQKGLVVNLGLTASAIKKAMSKAKVMAKTEIESVFAGVGGDHIKGIDHHGTVILSNRKNRPITRADVKRVINQTKAMEIPLDREILEVLPQEFIVDNQRGIIDPVGMLGSRLEAFVYVITGAVVSVKNIEEAIESAGLFVEDISFQPLASGEAVLDADEKKLGVILIEMGAGTTETVVYANNSVWHTGVVAAGGELVTSDIAIGLHTPLSDAEELKKKYGCALTDLVQDNEVIDVPTVGGRPPRRSGGRSSPSMSRATARTLDRTRSATTSTSASAWSIAATP